jgi:PAS domain S-box-containing protein
MAKKNRRRSAAKARPSTGRRQDPQPHPGEPLEAIFSSIHVLVAYLDTQFNFRRVNRAYAEADGRDPEFFLGKNHFHLYPNAENEAIFRTVVRTGRPHVVFAKPFTYASAPERGTTYWDWSLLPVKGADGRVAGLVLVLVDVTQRERAQVELERERQRLFEVLNILPGFVYLRAPDCSIRFTNRRFEEVFGKPAGRRCYEVLYGRAEPCGSCRVADVFETSQGNAYEKTLPNGRTYQLYDYPFTDADGSPLVLRLGIDVTDRKRLEREIAETSAAEQRRLGRDLHDVLGQHLTGLAFLSGVLTKRLAGKCPDEAPAAAQIADLANEAVRQARALARGLSPVDLSAGGLMASLEQFAAGASALYGCRCDFECPRPMLLQDHAVATHLYHVAREAVTNAVTHGRAKKITIRLAEADGYVTLEVTDDGTGIPDQLPVKGMGLRIMNYRASVIGGSLAVRNRPRGGVSVVCRLPRPGQDPPPKEVSPSHGQHEAAPGRPGDPRPAGGRSPDRAAGPA